jgi:N-acetylglutamate synthase-like GNAT family acetyltransferase
VEVEQVVHARVADDSDVTDLVRLINRAYAVEEFFVAGERTHPLQVRERMARSSSCFLVADDPMVSGRLAACVWVERRGDRGYFGMLAVDPDQQGRGLGRSLVTAAEEHCRAGGCRFLDISVVNLRTELPDFYRQLGFAPFGTAPFHEPGKLTRPAHLVLMTKPLVDIWNS